MGKDLTLSRARYLAEESAAIAHRPANYHQRRPGQEIDLPWHVRNLASITVGGIGSGLVILIMIVLVAFNQSDAPVDRDSDVQALVGVVEKMVEADLEKARMAQEKVEKARTDDQSLIVGIMFWVILAALFLGVASQYSGIWGVGIALFVILLLLGLIFVPGAFEAAKIPMAMS